MTPVLAHKVKLDHKKGDIEPQRLGHERDGLVLQVLEQIHIDPQREVKRVEVNKRCKDLFVS